MNVRKITLMSILIAIAIALSVIDSFIPSFIPGFKLGLANIVILIVLYTLGIKEAIIVNLIRVYLAALLRGTIFNIGFMMSLAGAILSLLVMIAIKVLAKRISILTVSITGAVFHSLGQILVAVMYFESANMFYYLPILGISSIVTGIIMGIIAKKIIATNIIQNQKQKHDF